MINTNYDLESGLNPLEDAPSIESTGSPYANIIAVRTADTESEKIKALSKATVSETVKRYIEEKYNKAIILGF